MENNFQIFDHSLLIKFFAGESSEEENHLLHEWLSASPANKKAFAQQKRLWDELSWKAQPETDIEEAFRALQMKIQHPSQKQRKTIRFYKRFSQVAAVLLILLTVAYFTAWQRNSKIKMQDNNQRISMIIPKGQQGQVKLPDGTMVWMNAGSTLDYAIGQSKGTREVFLQGEAFFDVARDEQRPFIVHTKDIAVKVLGTQFNVMSYADDAHTETTVAEGIVTVSKNDGKKNVLPVEITPNKKAIFDKSKEEIVVLQVEAELYTAWKEGNLVFRQESLTDIVKKLERRFDVNITLEGSELKEYYYTATFEKDKTMDEILLILQHSAPIRYKIEKNNITITKL